MQTIRTQLEGPSAERSFLAEVGMGLHKGYSYMSKYGENPEIKTTSNPEDIWELGGTYNYDANGTAPIVSLVSTESADNQVVSVIGQDINRNEVKQYVTLNGTTRVALETPLWRVYRMGSAENASSPTGDIFCYIGTSDTPTDAEKRAIITVGNNATLMSIYTIPRGKVGFLYRGAFGSSRSRGSGEMQGGFYSRRLGEQFALQKRIACTVSGTSIYVDDRIFPDPIPSGTDVKQTIEDVSATLGVFGAFDILLVDETLLDISFLQAIEQPGF